MRLKHLKLSGFKSFVDPTKIHFTDAMSAVVGPNGCGKSNIIDAVRWVLGESNAKHLRGDGMTDVIFNGSSARKPVSQASVELMFDNSEGKASGSWATFSEIAVKRQVSRDGQSDYFVNGQKCRRRDISDLLSGTGLGPRSYSIIEQGTISRLVESKPMELRGFIEEAAGITKYKERKRETENRIKHSRENLERLADLRHELAQQIASLEQQATQAEQYTALKKQERQLHQDIIVFRWQTYTSELTAKTNELTQQQSLQLHANEQAEASQQVMSTMKQQIEQNRVKLSGIEKQAHELDAQVARCQLNIEHVQQTAQQLTNKVDQLAVKRTSLQQQVELQEQSEKLSYKNFKEANDALPQLQLAFEKHTNELAAIHEQRELIELQFQQLNQEQQSISNQSLMIKQSIARIEHDKVRLDTQTEVLNQKRLDFLQQQQQLSPTKLSQTFEQQQQRSQSYQQDLEQKNTDINTQQHLITSVQEQLIEVQKEYQMLLNEQGTLRALISEQTTTNDGDVFLSEKMQLWEALDVDIKWQPVVELVLSLYLKSYLVPEMANVMEKWRGTSAVGFIDISNNELQPDSPKVVAAELHALPTLNSFITMKSGGSAPALVNLLSNVFCVETLEQADSIKSLLSKEQSVVTSQGHWLGDGFCFTNVNSDTLNANHGSLISLNERCNRLEAPLLAAKEQLLAHQTRLDVEGEQLALLEEQREQLTNRLDNSNQLLTQAKQDWLLEQQQWQHCQRQLDDVSFQLNELKQLIELEQQQLMEASEQASQLSSQGLVVSKQLEVVNNERASIKKQLKVHEAALQQSQQANHQQQLLAQKSQLQHHSASETLAATSRLLDEITQEMSVYQSELEQQTAPMLEYQNQRDQQQVLLSKTRINQQQCNETLTQLVAQHAELETSLLNEQQTALRHSKKLETLTVAIETLKVKVETQEQAIELSPREVAMLSNALEFNAQSEQWPSQLLAVKAQLDAMGAINLTAIEQYNEQKQRLDYLTNQTNDLENGLVTLETAIKKIDRESRDKFKLTFDSVNKDFQTLFPKVFGGGSAQLTLTESDLLIAGVSIMAQPPGKKNSTIHLLSGGEKALTALSLVFAIFQLNPAPFCMLDEVDAPLDDANVDRYCNLVKEMSEKVQFIYITHNKVSMEMASQLTGVTMQEAGVSRVVAVDVDTAVSLVQ
ncbi:chromosome segregation protein SMC [Psychrobium sp. 1_MG-2023]|uniref:chromosome segregation protein SMC n=1 Tax=Psychrobium sp. 1_MG-2023 TaxID=3062624 RepID=UPI000C3491DA|nr:chromosome segregation protein SMC [Psychrobium sp. 1_MG-2023]MDP2560173.1 chromosome segregation protein SMC [Psychrobium sp. 1_MG-2023]PKF56984.1 chromosome segregation protein SMC [Alteromonadales bacterium alter-6D02]